MRMNYRIAYSLGLDAANRQMSQGRTDRLERRRRSTRLTHPEHVLPALQRTAGDQSGSMRLHGSLRDPKPGLSSEASTVSRDAPSLRLGTNLRTGNEERWPEMR